MYKIAVIVPKDLINTAEAASKELNIEATVLEGSMSKGVRIAQKLEREGYEVFIIRGGTELLMEKSGIRVPFVSIPFTPMDILKAVKEAEKTSKRIGIIAFKNILPAVESYEEIADVKLEKYLVNDEEEVEEKMAEMAQRGIKVAIGGGIVNYFADKYGIKPVVISTGKEVFLNAILEAKRMIDATRKEKEHGEKFRAIIEHTYSGIISVDDKGIIKTFNPAAEKLFNIKSCDVKGRHINQIIPEVDVKETLEQGIDETDIVKTINGNKFIVSNIPIIVENDIIGAISFFQDVNKIQQMEEKIRLERRQAGHYAKYTFDDVIGKSREVKELLRIAKEYAGVDTTILIEGETGTGKEVMAQSIHNYSERALCPFVAVNCAAIPENLIESELFGYVPGAFTGADRKGKMGLFEIAHGGTIFLDEISEMNPMMQGRLLRVLQEKQIMRIGDNKLIPIDVRVIAATNRNLEKYVKEGKFREDLYYRLNILQLKLIPLRERVEDIECFIEVFTRNFCKRLGKKMINLTSGAVEYMAKYDWPGNAREIRNFAERMVVMSKKNLLGVDDVRRILPVSIDSTGDKTNENNPDINSRLEICNALKKSHGNITETAQMLGISRTTLWRKMKKYNIRIDN